MKYWAISAISVAGSATALAFAAGLASAPPARTIDSFPAIAVTYWAPTPQAKADLGPIEAVPAMPAAEAPALPAPAPADPIAPAITTPIAEPEPERASAGIDMMRTHLLALHNQARAAHGLRALSASPALQIAAQQQAEWLARHTTGELWSLGDRAHTGEGGSTFHQRIAAAGFPGQTTNESFGAFATPDAAFEWWLGDPWHRPQIVSGNFTQIGIGVAPHSSGLTTVFIVTYGGP